MNILRRIERQIEQWTLQDNIEQIADVLAVTEQFIEEHPSTGRDAQNEQRWLKLMRRAYRERQAEQEVQP